MTNADNYYYRFIYLSIIIHHYTVHYLILALFSGIVKCHWFAGDTQFAALQSLLSLLGSSANHLFLFLIISGFVSHFINIVKAKIIFQVG